MSKILHQIYNDNFQPSRLGEYSNIIKLFLEHNFICLPIIDLYKKISTNGLEKNQKYLILRHDIDSDPKIARKLFQIERDYGVKSSFYFRLSTLDFGLMREIVSFGSEASYHFEEVAAYCKKYHIKDRNRVFQDLPQIREIFSLNFRTIESKLGTKLRSIASHGDFINRSLNIKNNEITNDVAIRERLGIEVEAYDKLLLDNFDIYISDNPYPIYWHPTNPIDIIDTCHVVCILTHPRNTGRHIVSNLKQNFTRILDEITW